jgi:hypothetical protein
MDKYFNKILNQYSCDKCYFISKKLHHFKNHMENGIHYQIPFAIKNLKHKRINDKIIRYKYENDPDINYIINNLLHKNYENYDIYEFGTYSGWSLKHIINILISNNCFINNINGFDSLEGLSEEINDKLNHKGWIKNKMSVKEHGIVDVKDYIKFINLQNCSNYKKFQFFKGYFNDSLHKSIIHKFNLRPALFINIDCDIYSATVEVLEFIFENKLYINGITMIRYDDWGCFYENTKNYNGEFECGEGRAHKELINFYFYFP